MHLDIEVGDLDAAEAVAVKLGAVPLHAFDDHRVYADTAGHPLCLYLDPTMDAPLPGRMARIVIDCFSPRALAAFYEELLEMRTRVVDSPERVVIKGDLRRLQVTDDAGKTFDATLDPGAPMLAFQQSVGPAPRWPDPKHPAQMHLDLGFSDRPVALEEMERRGAIHLRNGVWADPVGHPHCT